VRRPVGRSVSIWLSAVDWDGRVAADAALGVRLLGASNATVRSWTVTLAWPGLRRLQLPLGRRAELGRWTVEAGLASADGRLVDAAARCHFDVDDGDSREPFGFFFRPLPSQPVSIDFFFLPTRFMLVKCNGTHSINLRSKLCNWATSNQMTDQRSMFKLDGMEMKLNSESLFPRYRLARRHR